MDNEKTPKINNKYYCEKCDFTCSKKSDYARHLSTAKHKRSEMDNEKTPKNATPYMCSCGNEYNHASGLSKHKKKCTYIQNSSKKEQAIDSLYHNAERLKETAQINSSLMALKGESMNRNLVKDQPRNVGTPLLLQIWMLLHAWCCARWRSARSQF